MRLCVAIGKAARNGTVSPGVGDGCGDRLARCDEHPPNPNAPSPLLRPLRPQVQFLRSARGMGGIISATTFGDTTAFYRAYFAAVERAVTAARQAAGAPLPAPLPLARVGRGAAAAERGAAPASKD